MASKQCQKWAATYRRYLLIELKKRMAQGLVFYHSITKFTPVCSFFSKIIGAITQTEQTITQEVHRNARRLATIEEIAYLFTRLSFQTIQEKQNACQAIFLDDNILIQIFKERYRALDSVNGIGMTNLGLILVDPWETLKVVYNLDNDFIEQSFYIEDNYPQLHVPPENDRQDDGFNKFYQEMIQDYYADYQKDNHEQQDEDKIAKQFIQFYKEIYQDHYQQYYYRQYYLQDQYDYNFNQFYNEKIQQYYPNLAQSNDYHIVHTQHTFYKINYEIQNRQKNNFQKINDGQMVRGYEQSSQSYIKRQESNTPNHYNLTTTHPRAAPRSRSATCKKTQQWQYSIVSPTQVTKSIQHK